MKQVKFGHHDDGTPWLETVGDYDPRGGPPYYHPGNPRATANTIDERKAQSEIFSRWLRLAGLVNETGGNIHAYGPGIPKPEPEYVDIIFPDDRVLDADDDLDFFTWEDVVHAEDAGLDDLASRIARILHQEL